MQIEEEKSQIELEIATLKLKKEENIMIKRNEVDKLSCARKAFEHNKTIKIGLLHHTYRFEVVKKAEKEIDLLNNFITEQSIELDKVKEKEKEVDFIYKKSILELKKKEMIKEEIKIMEYKKLLKNKKEKNERS